MKIQRPFNVCSLAYFLWCGLLCSTVLCRTSPRRIIQLLFIPVSTSGEYLYKSFMLRESRRGILLQCFKTRSDWERLETLYHCPSLRSNVSYIRWDQSVGWQWKQDDFILWSDSTWIHLSPGVFSAWKHLSGNAISIVCLCTFAKECFRQSDGWLFIFAKLTHKK